MTYNLGMKGIKKLVQSWYNLIINDEQAKEILKGLDDYWEEYQESCSEEQLGYIIEDVLIELF